MYIWDDLPQAGSCECHTVVLSATVPPRRSSDGDSITQCVAANKLAVGLGLLDDGLAARETEDAARPLGRVPLHAVAGRDLPEFAVVAEDPDVGRVRQLAVVRGRAEVRLALRPGERVQALACGRGVGGRSRRPSGRRGGRRRRGSGAGNALGVV